MRAGGHVQPLAAWLAPDAAGALRAEGRATDAILALDPLVLDVPAAGWENVNVREDLAP